MIGKMIFQRIAFVALFMLLAGCTGESEINARNSVLTTLSLKKLSEFATTYPDSKYADQLVREFIQACGQDADPVACSRLVYGALPEVGPWRGLMASAMKSEVLN